MIDEEFDEDFESLEGCKKLQELMQEKLKSLEAEVLVIFYLLLVC